MKKTCKISSAAYEQGFGRGGTAAEEVPLALDNESLQCPDVVTKAEWDATWPADERIEASEIVSTTQVEVIPVDDERLSWTLPERAGGLKDVATSRLLWLRGLVLGGPRADEVYLSTPGTKSNIRPWDQNLDFSIKLQ